MATIAPSAGLRRVYASAPAEDIILHTLELSHPAWSAPFYLTRYPEPFDAMLETGVSARFVPIPFALTPPKLDGQGQQSATLSISNVDREMSAALEEAIAEAPRYSIRVVYRIYLQSDKTWPQVEPLVLGADSVRLTLEAATATANRTDVLNLRFPNQVFTVARFPGLNR